SNSGGRNFRLVSAPVSDPRPENWQELIPHRTSVMLADVELFANHYVVLERENALPFLRVIDFRTQQSRRIAMPEAAYEVSGGDNDEWDPSAFRYQYESMV